MIPCFVWPANTVRTLSATYTQPSLVIRVVSDDAGNGKPSTDARDVATHPAEPQPFLTPYPAELRDRNNGPIQKWKCWGDDRRATNSRYPSWQDDVDDHSFPSNEKFENRGRQLSGEEREQRTIVMKGLSDRTTHSDLVGVIRGGALLDIYIRPRDRTASVSFVEPSAAQAFLLHAKKNDIYLHGKRIEVAWNDRQFFMPNHVRHKVYNGASRNLVICGPKMDMTEEAIRDDLEHIHNLVVIDVSFPHGDAYISTNSVHNAIIARTCMMSRFRYKGCRVEYYPDQCDGPLPKSKPLPKKEMSPPTKNVVAVTNRFCMLNMDGTEDGSSDCSSDGEDPLPSYASTGNSAMNCTGSAIAV